MENHVPSCHPFDDLQGIIEMEPDIENMTLNKYLEYEAEKERRSWRNVRSKISPTRHEGADLTLLTGIRV
ncbi:hypothetical protein Tco_0824329 [Tanacetum coccineum]|uniref:Uncharacterized protein n=1 Tax=Tanacetum coccineum TaxID=301880 RepID=A0ABQ5AKF8_9ASTR